MTEGTDHVGEPRRSAPFGIECDQHTHHRLLGLGASASALMCFTVARMMCPTNGRISDQYRRRSATRDRDLPAFLTQQGGALPVGQHGEVRGNLAPTGLGEADELGLRHVAPSRHSMTGFQYFPTAAKAISRPGLSPSSNQPQPAVGDQLGKRGSGYRTIPPAGSGPTSTPSTVACRRRASPGCARRERW
jgi:hypothetical protein